MQTDRHNLFAGGIDPSGVGSKIQLAAVAITDNITAWMDHVIHLPACEDVFDNATSQSPPDLGWPCAYGCR